MISFKLAMQNEKIAIIALVVIIVGVLSVYLIATSEGDIFNNLFNGTDGEISDADIILGDCVDVHYTGSFKINGTVFDTSHKNVAEANGIYDANRSYEPLKIFINPNGNLTTPEGYTNYSSSMIQGFLNGLIGMEEGEIKTVTIPPEEAYGIWNETLSAEMGMDSYPLDSTMDLVIDENKSMFLSFFTEVNITVNNTFDYGSLALGVNNTLNAIILNVTSTNLTYKLLPENGTTFTQDIFNWDITFIVTNNTSFTIHTDTKIGHTFSFNSMYGAMHFKVIDLNETSAKFAVNMGAPSMKFVGQTLVFQLEAVKVYKTSQEES